MIINTAEDLYREVLGYKPDDGQPELANRSNTEQQLFAPNSINTTGPAAKATPTNEITDLFTTGSTTANAASTASTPTTITDLYQQVLGRPPESQLVINDWTKQFGNIIEPEEVEKFKQVAQLELTNPVLSTLKGQILGQNLTGKWTGEGFGSAEANATDMAKIMADIGITDIRQFGKFTKEVPTYSYDDSGNPTQTGTETVTTYGNKTTGQEVPTTYGERQTGNAFGGTYTGEGNTGYRVQFDDKGNPFFYTTGASSSDIANWGPILALASVIPSPIQPFAIAANATISIDQGDILGGIASLAGLAGFSDVAAGARIAKAVDSGDPFAIVSSMMNSPFAGDIGGTMLTNTISLQDAGNALNIANNIANENWAGAITSAGQLVNSPDLATAAAAARFIKAAETNNFAGMYSAANGFSNAMNAANKVTDKDVALNIANTVASNNSAATEGTQLASLGYDSMSDAGNGFTLTGAGGETLNLDDFSGSDSVAADAALFNNYMGDLDATGNITDTTGLDMGEVIPDGGTNPVDDKGEVVITAKPESCPVGTKLNPETGECDPVDDFPSTPVTYLPTDDDFPPTPITSPTTPSVKPSTTPSAKPKSPPAAVKKPVLPEYSVQPGSQTIMSSQDPYANIKLMEELFGTDIAYKLIGIDEKAGKSLGAGDLNALLKLLGSK